MTARKTDGASTPEQIMGAAVPAPAAAVTVEQHMATQLAPIPHVDWPLEPTYEFMLSVLRRQVTVRKPDSDTMSMLIAERLLTADSVDATLTPSGPEAWENHKGTVYTVLGVSFAPSAYDGGCPLFASADVVDNLSGESFTMSVGAWSVVYALLRYLHRGELPVTCKLVESATGGGNAVYNLVKP